eukprot:Em0150g6a
MAETAKLIELLQQQLEAQRKQTEVLIAAFTSGAVKQESSSVPTLAATAATIPSFVPFDATAELWTDYWARFQTFLGANSVPVEKRAQVFLTNQSRVTYKLLSNLASQQNPPGSVNELSLEQIEGYMKNQFDPMLYIARERFKFWSDMRRKPGETVQELAARIHQDAVTCDFPSIRDPLDEALRTQFMCSISNAAVLKSLFKIKDNELTFARAIAVAVETEEAAKVAKETVYGSKPSSIHQIQTPQRQKQQGQKGRTPQDFPRVPAHVSMFTKEKESAAGEDYQAPNSDSEGNQGSPSDTAGHSGEQQNVYLEVDTGAGDNFCAEETWKELGKPRLSPTTSGYEVANGHPLSALGVFSIPVVLQDSTSSSTPLTFTVTKVPRLNLLGRDDIIKLGINVSALMDLPVNIKQNICPVRPISQELKPDAALQEACRQLCQEFPDLFKAELGCLKDFELDVKFKADAKPVFCKPRVVPFAIQEDLSIAYDAGIARGVWQSVQFNNYGTPVVPIRKVTLPGQTTAKLRVCGDYSVTVNPQLEPHRHPIPRPEDLMQKLGGGYGFTKIDLSDAYNQIMLTPESRRRLALSTHRGVLLQMRLPFGISSAPGYFQEIMDMLTSDLKGVAVYMDDILFSGTTTAEHLENLKSLLKRLEEKGLRCRLEKCLFAQPSVEYLGHILSQQGISKGHKVDAVKMMPPPENVSSLRSLLGSVQFYSKFLPNLASVTEPLHRLTKKEVPWTWGTEQVEVFKKLKDLLCADTVLAQFDPSLPIGISCDASEATIEYRKSAEHGNADALSRLPVGPDVTFDAEEGEADVDMVCTIKTISLQLNPMDQGVLAKESSKDPVIARVMRYTREGWPPQLRVVIPPSLRAQVLQLLHLGHFGMQRMKQLARTAVYWPQIDSNIMDLCHHCTVCAEHQNKPPKPEKNPCMLPEKAWSRVHIDHAINFLGSNWLVLIDAYSKYPCIHTTTSSTKSTTELLEQDFSHFSYPHAIVSDNATTFSSEEFQSWCRERGITHLTGAPYHPATNGAAERLVQTFKHALSKSTLPPRAALQEFLMQYRRTPLAEGYSPSEWPKDGRPEQQPSHRKKRFLKGQEKDPRWVPALVTKVFGSRSCNVKVVPKGSTWRRHIEQLRPRYGVLEDADPGEVAISLPETSCSHTATDSLQPATPGPPPISPVEGGPIGFRSDQKKMAKPSSPNRE